uniref:Uncharacterized protein n=1 Tax=Arundo donax TaxID=35708 RepID=A0A0A9APF9_ARUDO
MNGVYWGLRNSEALHISGSIIVSCMKIQVLLSTASKHTCTIFIV